MAKTYQSWVDEKHSYSIGNATVVKQLNLRPSKPNWFHYRFTMVPISESKEDVKQRVIGRMGIIYGI